LCQSEVLGNPSQISADFRAAWRALSASNSFFGGTRTIARHLTHAVAQFTYYISRNVVRAFRSVKTSEEMALPVKDIADAIKAPHNLTFTEKVFLRYVNSILVADQRRELDRGTLEKRKQLTWPDWLLCNLTGGWFVPRLQYRGGLSASFRDGVCFIFVIVIRLFSIISLKNNSSDRFQYYFFLQSVSALRNLGWMLSLAENASLRVKVYTELSMQTERTLRVRLPRVFAHGHVLQVIFFFSRY
jgi:hypothetical protein